MASPPESPIEEVVYELEQTRVPKPIPVALEDLCRQTKFTKQEIRVMYRGFKTVSEHIHLHKHTHLHTHKHSHASHHNPFTEQIKRVLAYLYEYEFLAKPEHSK